MFVAKNKNQLMSIEEGWHIVSHASVLLQIKWSCLLKFHKSISNFPSQLSMYYKDLKAGGGGACL